MARMPLLPQNLMHSLFEIYPHLPQYIESIQPGIAEEELHSPKDPMKYFLLSYLFLAANQHKKIRVYLLENEVFKTFIFDIELSEKLSQSGLIKPKESKESMEEIDFQEYIKELNQRRQQLETELQSDYESLEKLSSNLEKTLNNAREKLENTATSLGLNVQRKDLHHLFKIYEELSKRTPENKISGLNQFGSNQATSLADHLLNPSSPLSKICEDTVNDLYILKVSFYSLITKYFSQLIRCHERIQQLTPENLSQSQMSWIKQALFY